jgi:capsular exopolysaccharide synthesis family protein
LAAQAANTLAEVFIESNLESRLAMTRTTTSWLNERLESIRQDLNKSEDALQAFREKEQLVNVGGSRGLVEQQITDNAQRLRDAQRKKTELQSAYAKVQAAGNDFSKLDDISVLLDSKSVQDAKYRVLEETQKLKALESRYGPKHPLMATARASLDSAVTSYHNQLLLAAQGVKTGYEVAAETARQLSLQEQDVRAQVQGLDRKQSQMDALQRDVTTNRDLYNLFLTRFKETETAGNYQEVVARVVDPAVVPSKPFKPQKKKIFLWAVIAGLALGLLSALLRHMLSDTIGSSEDMELITGLQVLAALPVFKKASNVGQIHFIEEPKSGFSEGVRSVRTGLLLADLSQKRKKVVVTSSAPQEGKTTISCNLAIAMGQMERVLLIDCDLRRPSVAKVLKLPDKIPGLTEFMAGTASVEQCIFHFEAGKIDVMPVGQIPPNPGEVLASQKFHFLIESLAAQYDRIIFDSAPCQAVSDTLLLAQHVDAVLFTVKAEATTRSLVKNTVRQLRYAHAPLTGAIINAVDMKRYSKRYGGHYYDYSYYA